MPNHKPLPCLSRLTELFSVVEIQPSEFGLCSGLIWKFSRGCRKAGSVAGTRKYDRRKDRYDWYVRIDHTSYVVARVIYYIVHKVDPGTSTVDHWDRNTDNNNSCNLRLDCTGEIQHKNVDKRSSNTSGAVGVTWHKASNKWRARLHSKFTPLYVGYFTCKKEAALAYNNAALLYNSGVCYRPLNDLQSVSCDCRLCSDHISNTQ